MARGGVAESVDARDLKSFGMKILWGFKSPRPHPSRRGLNEAHFLLSKQKLDGSLAPFPHSNITPCQRFTKALGINPIATTATSGTSYPSFSPEIHAQSLQLERT